MLDNTPNQPVKQERVKINDESQGTFKEDNQIRFKTSGKVYVIMAIHIYLFKKF